MRASSFKAAASAPKVAALRGRQGIHPFHVPGHGDEAPLSLDLVETAEKKLAEAEHRFDDSEHRFRDLLAQAIEPLAFGGLQAVAHRLKWGRNVGRRRCFGKALRQRRMMRLPAQGN